MNEFLRIRKRLFSPSIPLKIALIYAAVGMLWILLTDHIISLFVADVKGYTFFATAKGWAFIGVTALMLYILIKRNLQALRQAEDELTRRRERERCIEIEVEEAKKEFYRGTIFSVTDGKLNLVSEYEIDALLSDDIAEIALTNADDLMELRHILQRISGRAGMPEERIHSLITAVGEAAANAIKHAGGGIARVGAKDGVVQVCIDDDGPGIDTLVLPRATLMRRFSTKPSMGLGYSLILALVDTVYLATGKHGTRLLMEKSVQERQQEIKLEALPDTW